MNFSEGRRGDIVDAICAAIEGVPDIFLLDREMDSDHNRAVLTFIGPPERIGRAAFEATRVAAQKIDLNVHRGEHPRIGATDVVPFVPIKGVTMQDCIVIAEETGRRIADELGIPVYLYEEAARRPERRDLSAIRKGQYEGLRQDIVVDPKRHPDFGKPQLHPTAGATAVGARMPLVAYNIYLDTPDVQVAKDVARAVRFSSGGLPYVKALGFEIEERNQAQVSMNLTNYESSPIFRAFEMVRAEADRLGARIVSSEIVGLVPQAALYACIDHFLKLQGFSPDLVLENRMARVLEQPALSVAPFLSHLAGPDPTPGGGSVAALAAALAAALGEMTCGVTIGKKNFERHTAALQVLVEDFRNFRAQAQRLVKSDSDAFDAVLGAYKLPKESQEQRERRGIEIEKALHRATEAPLETARVARRVAGRLADLVEICNPKAISDVGVGASQAQSALRSATYNVLINLASIKDQSFRATVLAELESLDNETGHIVKGIHAKVVKEIGGMS